MRWFRRKKSKSMETTPINNPLDYRRDGSIKQSDPAGAFQWEVMRTGQPGIARQREDGTWATEFYSRKDKEDDQP